MSNSIFQLSCQSQQYDWGKIGNNSKVALFSQVVDGFQTDPTKPYAELWMGTHPNGPSKALPGNQPLLDIIKENSEQLLTSKVAHHFKNDLPFLFKVLSVNLALSIQAHPNQEKAQELHRKFPSIYKDPNHKPEMAVALTPFEALCGFRPLNEILGFLTTWPEFGALIGGEVREMFVSKVKPSATDDASVQLNKQLLKSLFSAMMRSSDFHVENAVTRAAERLHKAGPYPEGSTEALFLRLNEQFPNDVGCFCALLLNYIILQPGEAMFLAANVPHAYLSGDCIECMAASDNVVRAGLTPKFKDVDTLVDMLTYDYKDGQGQLLLPKSQSPHTCVFESPVEEFDVSKSNIPKGIQEELKAIAGPRIILVAEGMGTLQGRDIGTVSVRAGHVYFVGANTPVVLSSSSDDELVVYSAYCSLA